MNAKLTPEKLLRDLRKRFRAHGHSLRRQAQEDASYEHGCAAGLYVAADVCDAELWKLEHPREPKP